MRQAGSAIGKAVAQRLVHGNRAGGSIEPNWPRSRQRRLRREVETECDAEITLFAIGMLLQHRPRQIGSEINIGGRERFTRDSAERCGDLTMKKSGHRLVVSDVAAVTLAVPEIDGAGADAMAIVAA